VTFDGFDFGVLRCSGQQFSRMALTTNSDFRLLPRMSSAVTMTPSQGNTVLDRWRSEAAEAAHLINEAATPSPGNRLIEGPVLGVVPSATYSAPISGRSQSSG